MSTELYFFRSPHSFPLGRPAPDHDSDRTQREARIHSPLNGVDDQCSLFEVG